MLVCIRWVDRSVIQCKLWAVRATEECKAWATEVSKQCTSWAQQTSQECTDWRDEGENRCKGWRQETSEKCCDWWPCSWACDAIVTVISWVCIGWYWVANWVCQAWATVVKWVCTAFEYIVKIVCVAFFWLVRVVCVVWGWLVRTTCWIIDRLRCFVVGVVDAAIRWLSRSRRERRPIEHVFVLMLENRSYDHMLGFADLSGTDAVTGELTVADGANPAIHANVDPADSANVPVGTPAVFKIEGTMDNDPGHEFHHVITQLAGGNAPPYDPALGYPAIDMSGFIATHRQRGADDPKSVMRCFDPEQLPVLTTLAREFAVCDRWFSSMPGPTWPNRFFAAAGSSGGLDDSPGSIEIVINTTLDGYRFYNGTIYDLLDSKCLPWKIYHGDELPVSFALAGMTTNRIADRFDDVDDFDDDVSDGYDAVFTFIEPHYGNILPGTSEDYTCGTSQHPLDDVTRGERLIKDVYEAIRNSDLWERSVLIITWDEHGGFYDHVEPPATVPPGDPPGDPDNVQVGFDFGQLGVRVPAVVVSPRIERGLIDHTPYDHTSIPATVQRLFGLAAMTDRDAQANDIRHLFNLETPRTDTPTTLPDQAESGWRCEDDPTPPEPGPVERRAPLLSEADTSEPELDPWVRQAVGLAARARVLTLRKWDAYGRLAVLEDLRRIGDDTDARRFVHHSRELFRRWSTLRRKATHRGYRRPVRTEEP